MKALLTYLLISILWTATAFSQVTLKSTDLESAVGEYLTQTIEAQSFSALLLDEQSLFIMGSGATTITLAVQKHLLNPTKNPLPNNLIDLLGPGQDLDLVIDSTYAELREFQGRAMESTFGNTLGAGREGFHIDLVTLHTENGRGILNNDDWQNQNSDLISTGLLKFASKQRSSSHPWILNTRYHIDRNGNNSGFLDVIKNRLNRYLDGELHYTAFLGKVGKNPKTVSAIKFISNNLRFNLTTTREDLDIVRNIVNGFADQLENGTLVLGRGEWIPKNEAYVFSRIHSTALKALNYNPEQKNKALVLFDELGISRLLNLLESQRPELSGFTEISNSTPKKLSCAATLF